MESKVNYTLVGIFVVLFTTAIIVAAFWLSMTYPYRNYVYYYVYIGESVSGLSIQSPVKLNGVEVGVVTEIELNPENYEQVRLLLKVDEEVPVSTSTVATLNLQGITGIVYVGLRSLSTQAPPLQALQGQEYPVIPYEPSLLVTLDSAFRDITTDVKTLSKSFKSIFDEQNTQAFKKILVNVEDFTGMLSNNSPKFELIMSNFSQASSKIPPMLEQVEASLSAAQHAVDKVAQAGEDASRTMGSGRAAIENISDQAIPSAVELLDRLNTVAANIEEVSETLRRNPSVIVRGKRPSKPGPGE
ncbi:MAG: MlaD family protein [Gammaproteobacteria bacterium]